MNFDLYNQSIIAELKPETLFFISEGDALTLGAYKGMSAGASRDTVKFEAILTASLNSSDPFILFDRSSAEIRFRDAKFANISKRNVHEFVDYLIKHFSHDLIVDVTDLINLLVVRESPNINQFKEFFFSSVSSDVEVE